MNFRKKLNRLIFIFLSGFVLLFVFRLIYGFSDVVSTNFIQSDSFNNVVKLRQNYASEKFSFKKSEAAAPTTVSVDQKYEKIATIRSKSSQFEEDEKQAKAAIEQFNAIIQFEQNRGNVGNRQLQLTIGIQPDKFDAFYPEMQKIGKILSKTVTKTDKTNEYQQLNAKKTSLEKIRSSLIDLKSKGGKIEEFVELENRILEIEEQLQGLGVQLGSYDEENEFCTVQFSLTEGKEQQISLMHRIKVALEWTIQNYLLFMLLVLFITASSYFILLILDKLKIIQKIIGKIDE